MVSVLINKSRDKAENSQSELFKFTTPNDCLCMPFGDRKSLLTTKPYNFDIRCQCNSESYEQHSFRWEVFLRMTTLIRIFIYAGRFFQPEADWVDHCILWHEEIFHVLVIYELKGKDIGSL